MQDLLNKLNKAKDLGDQLTRSIRIRELFDLPSDGTILVQHVKPSGSYQIEVRIIHNGTLVATMQKHDYEQRVKHF